MSELLKVSDTWHREATQARLEPTFASLEAELRSVGAVELKIEADGTLSANDVPVDRSAGETFGRALASAGVAEVVLTPGLHLNELARFLTVIKEAEPDRFVTQWVERGEASIAIV